MPVLVSDDAHPRRAYFSAQNAAVNVGYWHHTSRIDGWHNLHFLKIVPYLRCVRPALRSLCQWQNMSTAARDIPSLESFPPTGTPEHEKLTGYDLYRKLGSPKRIVAPMVEHSELPWRILSRRYGAELVYSPMINAKIYAQNNRGARRVREGFFNKELGEEGAREIKLGASSDTDRPLIVQVRTC